MRSPTEADTSIRICINRGSSPTKEIPQGKVKQESKQTLAKPLPNPNPKWITYLSVIEKPNGFLTLTGRSKAVAKDLGVQNRSYSYGRLRMVMSEVLRSFWSVTIVPLTR